MANETTANEKQQKPQQGANVLALASKKDTTTITYVPQEGDPSSTIWNGHKFEGNVPREVANVHEQMITQARGNNWFKVEGQQTAVAKKEAPKDSDAYRVHAIDWFKSMISSKEMENRWENEVEMRSRCGVGSDDIEYLMNLYAPKLAELKKAERAS